MSPSSADSRRATRCSCYASGHACRRRSDRHRELRAQPELPALLELPEPRARLPVRLLICLPAPPPPVAPRAVREVPEPRQALHLQPAPAVREAREARQAPFPRCRTVWLPVRQLQAARLPALPKYRWVVQRSLLPGWVSSSQRPWLQACSPGARDAAPPAEA